MKTADRIRNMLIRLGWDKGKVNASQVYKGHGHSGYGWYVKPFGKNPLYLGKSFREAKEYFEWMKE